MQKRRNTKSNIRKKRRIRRKPSGQHLKQDISLEIDELKRVIEELKEVFMMLLKKQNKKLHDHNSLECKLCHSEFASVSLRQDHFSEKKKKSIAQNATSASMQLPKTYMKKNVKITTGIYMFIWPICMCSGK